MTQEGYDKIVAEHEELVSVKRKEISERLKEAISYGDLSENSEYDEAKNEQAKIEARIVELEAMLKNIEIIEDVKGSAKTVVIGVKVKALDMEFDEECEYRVVGSTEANSLKGKISNESPVGKALMGGKVGDTVEVETPAGTFAYKILEIQRSN